MYESVVGCDDLSHCMRSYAICHVHIVVIAQPSILNQMPAEKQNNECMSARANHTTRS